MLFYLFAAINGLALSMIFAIYTMASIAQTFFITAGTFGAMSIFGYTTKQDLSKIGSFLYMALIGLIILAEGEKGDHCREEQAEGHAQIHAFHHCVYPLSQREVLTAVLRHVERIIIFVFHNIYEYVLLN